MKKELIYKIVTAVMVVTVLICAGYIMVNRLGLIEGYDFGGGAYYYVDIPEFQKILPSEEAFHAKAPIWVHVLLFIAWGWLMWRLFIWVDKKTNGRG